jgi:hypothetical protein
MEKMIDLHIPTIPCLHCSNCRIENALRYKQVTMSAFINVEDAFKNTGFISIRTAAERRHIEPQSVEWIIRMLECQIVRSRLRMEQVKLRTPEAVP